MGLGSPGSSVRSGGGAWPASPPPADLLAYRLDLGGSEFAVLEWPAGRTADARALLTTAERAVVALVLSGWSNAQVALRRGCSARTVANQLASAYRKLGVGSRAELAARVAAGGDAS